MTPNMSLNFGKAEKTDRSTDSPYLAISRMIATLLDTAFYIPGTRIRVGLDPILGLIPGLGDTLANILGSSLLFLGAQLRLPRIVLIRMALNLFVNAVIGAIPGIGDLFSFWFKSNIRNLALLERHVPHAGRASTTADWIFVTGLILLMLTVLVVLMLGTIWLIRWLWDAVQ
jgi:hypothetical protein